MNLLFYPDASCLILQTSVTDFPSIREKKKRRISENMGPVQVYLFTSMRLKVFKAINLSILSNLLKLSHILFTVILTAPPYCLLHSKCLKRGIVTQTKLLIFLQALLPKQVLQHLSSESNSMGMWYGSRLYRDDFYLCHVKISAATKHII